jgi:hypothetical protein
MSIETREVRLTYFKEGGKYYTEGTFDAPASLALFQIWEEVRAMKARCELPGIRGNEWHILITVPDHPHDHPHLIPA